MPFGYARSQGTRFYEPETQEGSLRVLGELTNNATIDPLIRGTALKIIRGVPGRDDVGELEALYEAVKHGDPEIPSLRRGVKYVADPRFADYFSSPVDTLKACAKGACGEDCDGQAALMCALAGSLGWKTGLRAWGRAGSDGFVHVYPVVLFPKRPPFKRVVALDTTVPEFEAGDEPPRGNVMTAWLT